MSVNGNTYTTTGIYTEIFVGGAASGCDSTVVTDLTVVGANINNIVLAECPGYSITVNGNAYNTTGVYTEVIAGGSYLGCDSTVTLDLTILAPIVNPVTVVNCSGNAYLINGSVYANTGLYNVVFAGGAASGCDSTVALDLTILAQVTSTMTLNECQGYSIDVNGTTYNATGVYTEVFSNASVAGCDSIVTIDLTIAGPIDVMTTATDTSITADNANGTYEWIDCDNGNAIIAGETNQTFNATANGNYAVIVTEGNCSDTSDCVIISVIGLTENMLADKVNIHPNPTSGMVTVELSDLKNATITVTDNMGRVVYTTNSNQSIVKVNLSDFEGGIYFFNIETAGGSIVKPVVVK